MCESGSLGPEFNYMQTYSPFNYYTLNKVLNDIHSVSLNESVSSSTRNVIMGDYSVSGQ